MGGMSLMWGMAITFGICVGGGVSGAHFNPAVTVPLAMFSGFPWEKVIPYIVVQIAVASLAPLECIYSMPRHY